MSDELTPTERHGLQAWEPMAPPEGFADRVLDARKLRRGWITGGVIAASSFAAAAVALFVIAGRSAPNAPVDVVAVHPPETTTVAASGSGATGSGGGSAGSGG